MRKAREGNKLPAVLLAIMISPAFFNSFGQNSTPIKVSLRSTGSPQFPGSYWMGDSDPHFRHHLDTLFWLSPENVATTFFKGFCCRSGDDRGLKYGAAVFDISGKRITTHDWTSMPDAPFGVEGVGGAFWLRYPDHIDVLDRDFMVTGQIPLHKSTHLTRSKRGSWIAVKEEEELSIYRVGETSAAANLVLPLETWVVDINSHAVLLNSRSYKSCYVAVWQTGGGPSWMLDSSAPVYRCTSGEGLLSDDAVLIKRYQPDRLEIVHRDGSVEAVPGQGNLLGIAASGRIALQTIHPSHLAEFLDMDFGGQKEITVYDPSKKIIIFRKTIGGQAGAALAPDGNHLAIIDGSSLLIYSLP